MADYGEAAGSGRPSYFQYKVLDDPTLQHRLSGGKGWWHRQQSSCEGWREQVSRFLRLAGFLFTFCLSLFRAMAPWCVALIETGTMMLLWFMMTPHRVKPFHYTHSLQDLVLLSIIRCPSVLLAYALGMGHRQQRPYWFTAVIFAAVGYMYVAVKLCFFHQPLRPAPLSVFLASVGFTTMHLLIAHDVRAWAQRRYEMGLLGLGYPWEEGEVDFARGQKQHHESSLHRDVPSRALADPDSKFLQCSGLDVHYKEAFPQVMSAGADACIVLTHGFGAGVFAWRHVMQPLANACGCRVLAYDRAGFGLTSRPLWSQRSAEPNPYSNPSQAHLIQKICSELGLDQVILAGHSDGALITLMAAAQAVRRAPHLTEAARQQESVAMTHNDCDDAEGGSAQSRTDPFQMGARASSEGPDAVRGVTSRHSRRGSLTDVNGGQNHVPQVVGICLTHPCFAGEARPQLARMLGRSRLGWGLLRSLLRSEVGLVSRRHAWHDSRKLTPEVLAHYKKPLQVEGWDRALIEVANASKGASPADISAACRMVSGVPALVVVGERDRIAPSAANAARLLAHSRLSILPSCGHLSHEEVPGVLVGSMSTFVREAWQAAGGHGSL